MKNNIRIYRVKSEYIKYLSMYQEHIFAQDAEKDNRKYIGVVFQSFNLLTKYTALENVVLSMDVAGYKTKNTSLFSKRGGVWGGEKPLFPRKEVFPLPAIPSTLVGKKAFKKSGVFF